MAESKDMSSDKPIGHRWDKQDGYRMCLNCGIVMDRFETPKGVMKVFFVSGHWTAARPSCEPH